MFDLSVEACGVIANITNVLGLANIEKFTLDAVKAYVLSQTLGLASFEHKGGTELRGAILDGDSLDPKLTLRFMGWLNFWLNVPGPHDEFDTKFENEIISTYSIESGKFSVNLKIHFEWNSPVGTINCGTIELDEAMVEDWLDDEVNDLFTLLPHQNIVIREVKSNYDKIKKKYEDANGGPKNVYFASPQFVRWAGTGTLTVEVIKNVVTGGAAFKTTMARAKREAKKELGNVADWLNSHGVAEFQSIADKILSGDIDGLALPDLKLIWQPVKYWSKLKVGGRTVIGEFASTDHAAFIFVWTPNAISIFPHEENEQSAALESPIPPDNRKPEVTIGSDILPLPEDIGTSNDNAQFSITFTNATTTSIRVKTVRVVNASPQVFSIDLQPGATSPLVTFLGGSTRGLAAWRLSDGRLISLQSVPIYSNMQITVAEQQLLPLPEDIGFGNQLTLCVRFKNDSQRQIRIKTVRVINSDPVVFTVDLPPNTISSTASFFGQSTRMFAVWTLPDRKLVSLQALVLTQAQTVSYRELVEVRGGVEVTVGLLMPQSEILEAAEGVVGS